MTSICEMEPGFGLRARFRLGIVPGGVGGGPLAKNRFFGPPRGPEPEKSRIGGFRPTVFVGPASARVAGQKTQVRVPVGRKFFFLPPPRAPRAHIPPIGGTLGTMNFLAKMARWCVHFFLSHYPIFKYMGVSGVSTYIRG